MQLPRDKKDKGMLEEVQLRITDMVQGLERLVIARVGLVYPGKEKFDKEGSLCFLQLPLPSCYSKYLFYFFIVMAVYKQKINKVPRIPGLCTPCHLCFAIACLASKTVK